MRRLGIGAVQAVLAIVAALGAVWLWQRGVVVVEPPLVRLDGRLLGPSAAAMTLGGCLVLAAAANFRRAATDRATTDRAGTERAAARHAATSRT